MQSHIGTRATRDTANRQITPAKSSLLETAKSSADCSFSIKRRTPTAVVGADSLYFSDLCQALNQCGIHVVAGELDQSLSLAVEHQPDIILVASPPIGHAMKTCQSLLENPLTTNIPIFVSSLGDAMVDNISSIFLKGTAKATPGEFHFRQSMRSKGAFAADDNEYGDASKRRRQLLNVLDLLRYAEDQISRLNLETSTVLLGATVADVARNLK
ncbi:hypothetical protein GGD65_006340 [Bradyrhizobium sp. CIR18]|uniref:hypothetical protein n=1 Tax=Bradyrhizobium sp. CIR18 TaxID=2663839 RepID=UPI001605E775|nr:hypothetical protein [Bradyrhizobium sp. CIR18]MBB4365274.1 hypothetical protein [Bradyrhizobium sp. CIR18]